jgi:hypothetical protein
MLVRVSCSFSACCVCSRGVLGRLGTRFGTLIGAQVPYTHDAGELMQVVRLGFTSGANGAWYIRWHGQLHPPLANFKFTNCVGKPFSILTGTVLCKTSLSSTSSCTRTRSLDQNTHLTTPIHTCKLFESIATSLWLVLLVLLATQLKLAVLALTCCSCRPVRGYQGLKVEFMHL